MSSSNDTNNEPRTEQNAQCGADENVRRAFAALPFEQKITTLLRVELDMLGDAINTVVSAASKAADTIVNACTSSEAPDSEPASAGGSSAAN